MLAVLAADGARLDAGSVALALARRWSGAGESVLLVDADPSGAELAQRFGDADHAEYSPAQRGLPSLMVAREPLTPRLLANHCYSLDTAAGSLWALFGPHHRAGAELAARWLAERSEALAAVDAQRSVVVSSSLTAAAEQLAPVLRACDVVVTLAAVDSVEDAAALWHLYRDLGLTRRRCPHRALIVEGDPPIGDDDIGIEAGMHTAGRLPVVADDRILRMQLSRRERAFAHSIDTMAPRLLRYSQLVAAKNAAEAAAGRPPAPDLAALQQKPALDSGINGSEESGVNGSDAAHPPLAHHAAETAGAGDGNRDGGGEAGG